MINKTIELTKMKIGMQLAGVKNPQFEIEQYAELLSEQFVLSLKAFVWGEKTQDIDIIYPLTWWDGFKAAHFPQWLQEKFPPVYKHVHIDVDAILPEFRLALPDEHYTYILTRNEWRDDK